MVEKIDKPEGPPAYYVQATTGAKDDRGGQGKQQNPDSDEYSGSHAAPGWQKIYSAATDRRYLKLRRDEIAHAWFRRIMTQRGIALAEVDLETKDGRMFKGAHAILAREDFWTLKKFQPGQNIQLNMIAKEPILEISVPNPRPQIIPPSPPLVKGGEGGFKKSNLRDILIYAAIGIVAVALIVFAIVR